MATVYWIAPILRSFRSEERIAAYQMDAVHAVRTQSVHELRRMIQSGVSLDCCNRFGETWPAGSPNISVEVIVVFLAEEAEVSLLLRDDYGRNVLHDAFWSPIPRFELVDFLLQRVPDLLSIMNVRDHVPLCHSIADRWEQWNAFLNARRSLLHRRGNRLPSFSAGNLAAREQTR
jgi:hypothetical protein